MLVEYVSNTKLSKVDECGMQAMLVEIIKGNVRSDIVITHANRRVLRVNPI